MTVNLPSLSPTEAAERLRQGRAVLVDIREPDEFARRRIGGSISQPLSVFERAQLQADPQQDIVFTCRSGMRT